VDDDATGDEPLRDDDLDAMTYEQLVEALEEITAKMAAGDIGIEKVADLYERAGQLHGVAASRLERVRERIEGLAAGADGEASQHAP
jgi:exodeoxyribonuclease VII small subunit